MGICLPWSGTKSEPKQIQKVIMEKDRRMKN